MLSCSSEEEFLCDECKIFKYLRRMAMEETIDAAAERLFYNFEDPILYLGYLETHNPEIKKKIKECLKGIQKYFDEQEQNIEKEIELARDSLIEMLKPYIKK